MHMHNKAMEVYMLAIGMVFLEQDMMSLLSNEALVATAQDYMYMYIFALQFWDTGYLSKYTVSQIIISRIVPGEDSVAT